jgi:uncharacterized protein YbjT (DUF2867 family)
MENHRERVLVTGATGYVGGRLVPRLVEEGYPVRVLVRDSERLQGRLWLNKVQVIEGDVLKPKTLPASLEGINIAYYLIHSMSSGDDFHKRDLLAAENFGKTAKEAGVRRIIYLGGLGDSESNLSIHLRSRQLTGDRLRASGVLVTEFRASIIIGSGSASFEMIRYLTERIPVIIAPRWVYTCSQPIGIDDILQYLIRSICTPSSEGRVIEIGGQEVLTYAEMIKGYADVRGLRRYLIPIPIFWPKLFSYLMHWTSPVHGGIAKSLFEGLRNEVIVKDPLAETLFPGIHPMDYKAAVKQALEALETSQVESTWTDSLAASVGDSPIVHLGNTEGMITETRQLESVAQPETIYQVFTSLGGSNGWLFANILWHIRGIMDRAVGGVGLRRGRRHPTDIRIGDPLDFYRVEALEPNRMMRLRAEMKVPGEAWMEFRLRPLENGSTLITQTAYFAPKGLFGHLYWYILYPIHSIVFSGLINAIRKRSEKAQKSLPQLV